MDVDRTIRSRRFYCSLQRLAPVALLLILVAFAAVYQQSTSFLRSGPPDLARSTGVGAAPPRDRLRQFRADEEGDDDPATLAASLPLAQLDATELDAQPQQKSTQPSVAICLVGGARAFELTGLTIKKYVLDVYDNADVFLHSPLDKDSHKFSMLRGSNNLAAARIFAPQVIPTSRAPGRLLTPSNSPNGIQGLLQYFSLVEGCITMIQEYAAGHNISYDWVVRTRVDTFWNAPVPPLSSFSNEVYTVPYGSQFEGLNDRFGIGNWRTSQVALARLSLLPLLHSEGYVQLNSESAFKLQLVVSKVPYQLRQLPFCVLSRRKYPWPPTKKGVPVASILSKGPLNGAKCRPCTPKVTDAAAAKLIANRAGKKWGWLGPVDDLQLCDATGDWDSDWEDVYTQAVGTQDSGQARERLLLKGRSLGACVEELEGFKQEWDSWEAPSSQEICALALAS